jgi:hypothetical protein
MGDKITIGATTIQVEEAPWNVLRELTVAKKKEKTNPAQVALPSRKGFGRVSNAQLRAAFNALDDDERQQKIHILFLFIFFFLVPSFLVYSSFCLSSLILSSLIICFSLTTFTFEDRV